MNSNTRRPPRPCWKYLNPHKIKRDWIKAIEEGWSLPVARMKAGVTDYGFRMLFENDEDVKRIRAEYVHRKNQQQRHPHDRD